MINVNIEKLVEIKNAVDSSELSQKVEVQNAHSFVVEGYCERRKKLEDIKDYIESSIKGISVDVSGGYNKPDADEPDGMKYDPIIITTYKNDDKKTFSRIKMDGFYMTGPNTARLVYDTYLDFIVSGNEHIEHGMISFGESVIADALDSTCLSECGFTADGNSLCQFKEEKVYTIITDISKEVEGVIIVFLQGEDDPSLVVVCKGKNILLFNDCFYIDAPEEVVA
ncbi:MAG: hypothetical protein PHF63_04640 [Herbinix sp.]|nr:hypothetical protein [Herbinix sp.]